MIFCITALVRPLMKNNMATWLLLGIEFLKNVWLRENNDCDINKFKNLITYIELLIFLDFSVGSIYIINVFSNNLNIHISTSGLKQFLFAIVLKPMKKNITT